MSLTTDNANQERNFVRNEVTRKRLMKRSILTSLSEFVMEKLFLFLGSLAILLLILIVTFLIRESSLAFREVGIWEYILGKRWYPSSNNPGYGALPFIISSFMVTFGALVLAIPWGIATAIYISEVAPKRVREILKPVVEVLAIFPSVVLGFIALVILSPIVASVFGISNGLTAFTASVILSVMALPTIISIAEDSIKSVPKGFREAALALGATRWEVVKLVCLPAARSGIVAAVMLGFGRVIGETMTVLMAAGNAIDMPLREFFGVVVPNFLTSVRTLTANIAIEGSDVPWGGLHYSSLFVTALILFAITFAVNLLADIMISRQRGAMRLD